MKDSDVPRLMVAALVVVLLVAALIAPRLRAGDQGITIEQPESFKWLSEPAPEGLLNVTDVELEIITRLFEKGEEMIKKKGKVGRKIDLQGKALQDHINKSVAKLLAKSKSP